jgi:hypothetical protein
LVRTAIKPGEIDDTDTDSDDMDIYIGYRRPEIVDSPVHSDPDLSDHVRTRLLIARLRAMKKYQETWS